MHKPQRKPRDQQETAAPESPVAQRTAGHDKSAPAIPVVLGAGSIFVSRRTTQRVIYGMPCHSQRPRNLRWSQDALLTHRNVFCPLSVPLLCSSLCFENETCRFLGKLSNRVGVTEVFYRGSLPSVCL